MGDHISHIDLCAMFLLFLDQPQCLLPVSSMRKCCRQCLHKWCVYVHGRRRNNHIMHLSLDQLQRLLPVSSMCKCCQQCLNKWCVYVHSRRRIKHAHNALQEPTTSTKEFFKKMCKKYHCVYRESRSLFNIFCEWLCHLVSLVIMIGYNICWRKIPKWKWMKTMKGANHVTNTFVVGSAWING